MDWIATPIAGLWVLEPQRHRDARGFFARTLCQRDFAAHGVDFPVLQASVSFNEHAGTLRGMHYQRDPFGEIKLVRCTAGAIFDVAVDLRPDSPTYCQWYGAELSANNLRQLLIPVGCAHGFQTLAPASEVAYQIAQYYEPSAGAGVRWDDPTFGIRWPDCSQRIMHERDANYPDYVRAVRQPEA